MPNSDPMSQLVRISSPALAPLSPTLDTTPDQLSNFYQPTALPMVRHSPLPTAASASTGAAAASIAQTTAGKIVYGSSTNLNQIAPSTSKQGALNPVNTAINNLSATSFQGAWSASTTYSQGASVDYSGTIYISLQGSNIDNTPSSSPTYWVAPEANSSVFLGDWVSTTTYVLGNQVIDATGGGGYYICLAATSLNQEPSLNPTDWQEIVAGNVNSFEGAWSNATAYTIGETVTYQGSVYVAIAANTNKTPSSSSSYWTLLGSMASFEGTWSNATAYQQNMFVVYQGNVYQASAANTNETPSSVSAYWQLVGPATLDDVADGVTYAKIVDVSGGQAGTGSIQSGAVNVNDYFTQTTLSPLTGSVQQIGSTLTITAAGGYVEVYAAGYLTNISATIGTAEVYIYKGTPPSGSALATVQASAFTSASLNVVGNITAIAIDPSPGSGSVSYWIGAWLPSGSPLSDVSLVLTATCHNRKV